MSEQQAYDIRTFSKAYGISRSQAYVEIKSSRLTIFKVGRRTLISRDAAETWRRRLEEERARSLGAPADRTRQAVAPHVSTSDSKSRATEAAPDKTIQRPAERS